MAANGPNPILMQWSLMQWRVWPNNIHEIDHSTSSDWARKEILGTPVYREWVGEKDEELHIRGKLFPYFYAARLASMPGGTSNLDSGLATIQVFDNMRKAGIVDVLIRGDGAKLGWYVVDRLTRQHRYLGPDGIGREIDFEAVFVRVPTPDPKVYMAQLWPFLAPNVGGAVSPEVAGAGAG